MTWQAATSDGGDRRPALVSLTLSLAAALASHYYAVLVFATLGIGEVVRSASRRRVDPPVWIALGVAAIGPLLAFAPLILSSRQYAGTFWSPVRLRDVPWVYMELLNAGMLPLALTGLMAAGCAMFRGPYADEPPRRPPPIHEVAAAVAFVALPLIAFVIAKVVTRAFVGRYALPAVIGFSSVVALALYALPRGRALTGTALILALGGSFVVGYRDTIRDVRADARTTLDDIQMLEHQSDPRLAIVASEPHVFMVLAHYAPAGVTSRLVYLTDPDASLRRLGHNSVDRGMRDLIGPWFRLPVEGYRSYLAASSRFLLYGDLGRLDWIADQLREDRWRLQLTERRGENYLFLVTRPGPSD